MRKLKFDFRVLMKAEELLLAELFKNGANQSGILWRKINMKCKVKHSRSWYLRRLKEMEYLGWICTRKSGRLIYYYLSEEVEEAHASLSNLLTS